MKKIYLLVAITAMLALGGCNDFLSLTPRETRVVETIEDYRDIFAGYMNLLKTPNPKGISALGGQPIPKFNVADRLCMYTGEVTMSTQSTYFYNKKENKFTSAGINMQTWLLTGGGEWNAYYGFLGPINFIINGVQEATGNNEDLRKHVLGEALVWRAFSFFKLVQYYAPYDKNEYGVPVYLDPTYDVGNVMPERKTQKEVYAQIINDMNWAFQLLETSHVTEWTLALNADFMNAMMASIYTYKAGSAAQESSDWANAENHARLAIGSRQLTNDPATIKKMFDCSKANVELPMVHDEFYFRLMSGDGNSSYCSMRQYYSQGDYSDGKTPDEYKDLFTTDDIRTKAYFDSGIADKYSLNANTVEGGCVVPFRLADMYLIRAEALCKLNKPGEAKVLMDLFCSKRYTAAHDVPADPYALLNAIYKERQKEFYLENDMRWLDMKRLGITRTITIGGEINILTPDDFRYSFPIPQREMELNMKMKQTPGWEKVILM